MIAPASCARLIGAKLRGIAVDGFPKFLFLSAAPCRSLFLSAPTGFFESHYNELHRAILKRNTAAPPLRAFQPGVFPPSS
jgi:hypothetical protein